MWLCVDQAPTALGRHPRLRCGVLYHVANRTLSFHGIARDAVQFLLPLFEDWTCILLLSLSCLPCDRQVPVLNLIAVRPVVPSHNVRHLSPILAVPNLEVLSHNSVPLRCRLLPSDNHSSTGVAGSTPLRSFSLARFGASIGRRVPIEPATTFSLARGSQSVAGSPSSFTAGSQCLPDACSHASQWSRFPI